MNTFLNALIVFINEARSAKADGKRINQAACEILGSYRQLRKEPGFWGVMDREFLGDVELYALLLSAIYYITKDAACLEKAEELTLCDNIDLFLAGGILYQVRSNRFRNSLEKQASYAVARENSRHLLDRLLSEYEINLPFIPYHERNKRRIVIMTDALLSRLHAPTNIVLDICKILGAHGYEVYLAVCVTDTNGAAAQVYSVCPFQARYIAQYNGDFMLDLDGREQPGYQMLLGKNTVEEWKSLLWRIHDWKPLCVWYVGGNSFWHDVCTHFITTISMPCTANYSASEADVLVSYMRTEGESLEEARRYILQRGQKTVDIKTGRVYEKLPEVYRREDYGIPADSFLIAIVGNRLEDELSKEFLNLMEQLARKNSHIYYVIIGPYSKRVESKLLEGRMVFLGFRKDLLNVLEMTDLFLNPPRKGGGGGAARAQAVGKPVLSLKYCDVAAISGEEFCCDTLEEMDAIIDNYSTDRDYYNKMAQKAMEKHKKRSGIDMGEQYGSVLKSVEAWLQNGELR